jgi:hypothetical protein
MKYFFGIFTLILISCQATNSCNRGIAIKKALAFANSRFEDYQFSNDEYVLKENDNTIEIEFYKKNTLGGGILIYVDSNTCDISRSILTQ